mmetsp:Transcript_43300/g.85098  ORF Transcript_43300/g.85098 Transcript_43300/m.85098 type:complete len:143 (-) Transcript_43300:133-561(-)
MRTIPLLGLAAAVGAAPTALPPPAFAAASGQIRRPWNTGTVARRRTTNPRRPLAASDGGAPDDGDDGGGDGEPPRAPPSLLEKIEAALDAPLLDPNDYSDQGWAAEALKEFVRGQPEVAQVAFSVVAFGVIFAVGKAVGSLF